MANSPPQAQPPSLSGPHSPPARKTVSLENVPDDISYLIFSHLHVSSPAFLFTVARVSKALHCAALPFIDRHLVLDNDSECANKQEAYKAIIKRFDHDTISSLAPYVRSITVKHHVSEADVMLILETISTCGVLHKLWYPNSLLHYESLT